MNLSKIARQHNVSHATVKRWQSHGYPIGDYAAMKELRKQLRPGKPKPQVDAPPPETPPPETPDSPPKDQGAAAALKRLEVEEVTLYGKMQTALASGRKSDAMEHRSDWLKVSDALRRYDLLVEQARRDSGQLVPLEAAQAALRHSAMWWRLGLRQWLIATLAAIQTAPTQRDALALCDSLPVTIAGTMDTADESSGALPAWAKQAIDEGLLASTNDH